MNKPYIVQLSNKTEVQIDSNELTLIADGIKSGSPIRLKRGIINPSFIVCVVPDMKRYEAMFEFIPGVYGSEEYNAEKERRRAKGCAPLKDIFNESPLMKLSTPTPPTSPTGMGE